MLRMRVCLRLICEFGKWTFIEQKADGFMKNLVTMVINPQTHPTNEVIDSWPKRMKSGVERSGVEEKDSLDAGSASACSVLASV